MIEIESVKLSKNAVYVGEKVIVEISIKELLDFPLEYPYDFPVCHVAHGNQGN